jgi:HEPN domain-containing protein
MKKPPEEVANWIMFAEEDLSSAKILFKENIFNKVCFFSQQVVEKSLKAFLLFRGKDYPKTHKIIEILERCVKHDRDFKIFEDSCLILDRYYIPTRYPDAIVGSLDTGMPSKENASEALGIANDALSFVKRKVSR